MYEIEHLNYNTLANDTIPKLCGLYFFYTWMDAEVGVENSQKFPKPSQDKEI